MQAEDFGHGSMSFNDLGRHIYCMARSGHGKSALIRGLVHQLITDEAQKVYPCAVIYIDPKGDDALAMLREAESLDPSKVTILDAIRTGFAVNPLELPPYRDDEDRMRVASLHTGFTQTIMKEWFGSDKTNAPRMLRIIERLQDALYALTDAPTWIDMHDIVTTFQTKDRAEMAKVLATLQEALGKAGADELSRALDSIAAFKEDAFDPVQTRIERFATDPYLKKLFSIRHSTVDFSELIKPGHLTVVRVPAGEVGEQIRNLIMSMVVLKLWFTILERTGKTTEEERTPVILAVDEFQNLQSMGILQVLLAEARSHKLGLWLAHQNLAQIDDKMLGAILGNTATQIAGRLAGEDASRIARNWERNSELEKAIESRLVTLPDWTFLVREQAQPGKEQQPPYQIITLPPPVAKRSYDDLKPFMEEMRQRYGLAKVEKSLFSEEARMKWMSFLSEDYPALPTRETWLALTALEKKGVANKTNISRMTALERDSPGAVQEGGLTTLLEKMKDDRLIEIASVKKRGPVTAIDYRLSAEGTRLLKCGYTDIGKDDAQEIAAKAREYYVSHGQFFQVCRQDLDMPRKPDAAAYDYLNQKAIAVEIESPSHVGTHADQLMRHFQEIEPFNELHVWVKKESEAKVQELLRQLPADQTVRVKLFVV